MSSNDSVSEHEYRREEALERDQAETGAQNRRNPVHYTDTQIVKMLGATATANPYGAPHGDKTRAWNAAVAECNDSGLFPFEVTKKGLQDKITSLLNSLEKPRKTKFGATQSRTYNSEIDNLRKIRQDAELKRDSGSARRFERAQRQEREGQIARNAALQTWRESQAEQEQSIENNPPPPHTGDLQSSRKPSPEPQADQTTPRRTRNGQDSNSGATSNQSADPTAVLRQLVKSTRQINQTEGARFERMHGNIATSTEVLQDISEQLRQLRAIGEETNALLRALVSRPQPPFFDHPNPHYPVLVNTPGAGPGPLAQARSQKRQRTESPVME